MFINLLSLSSLAVFLISSLPQPATALAVADAFPHSPRGHTALARRKRSSSSKQCKHRPTSAAPKPTQTPASTQKAKPTSTAKKPASTPKANTSSGNSGSGSNSNSNSSGNNTPSSSVGNPSTKIGMAWPQGNSPSIYNFKGPSAIYTWSPACPDIANKAGMDCFPMNWGQKDVDQFKQVSATSNSEWFMGFNECNEPGQCNMSPEEAAAVWKTTLTPLKKKGKKIVCPSTSSNPNGLPWVQNFLKACGSDCECDAIAIHFYDNTIEKFKTYVELWHNSFPDKPIWVTEFGCVNFNGPQQPSPDYIYEFMGEVTRWMDTLSYVDRYFAFGFSPTPGGGTSNDIALMNTQGMPTKLGQLYLNH